MPPLNPFLRAFFRSPYPSQCQPASHHVLLVPTTEVLFSAKDRETNVSYAELASSEEFIASHVLRVPGGAPPQTPAAGGNVRETKGKPKPYSTINGRTVVVKDTFVYSNKGFKTLNQAQLLSDAIYYPDSHDGQQWLVYYISRPLIGSFQSTPLLPAIISDEPSKERKRTLAEASGSEIAQAEHRPMALKKRVVKNFGDLLMQFPMISRQMQGGLEKVIRDLIAANDQPIGKRDSRRSSTSSHRSTPSLSDSVSSLKSSLSGASTVHPTALELEPEEESIRSSLETAITSAIDLFQGVDKTQLSLLGANTELTGPVVERMIERYVTEQVHDQTLFPRVCAVRRPDDAELDSKIRKMADVDIAQLGIPIEGGMQGKRDLSRRLDKGIEAFEKMGVASSPQEMLEILLNTQKAITSSADEAGRSNGVEKLPSNLTINADVLVSMLLIVVIRSSVRHLHSRLLYMRYFIFIDEVETGEQGYALATLEAVLAHLSGGSKALRRASQRNRALWQAAKSGDVQALEAILQPDGLIGETVSESPIPLEDSSDGDISVDLDIGDENEIPLISSTTLDGGFGSLQHVFPFQKPPTPPPDVGDADPVKKKKRVSMAPRSQSQSSAYSSRSHSRTKSVDSISDGSVHNDLSAEKLAQTQDGDGSSVLMMTVDARQAKALHFLLSIPAQFRAEFVLDDVNNEGTTLLSAAVQSGDGPVIDELLSYLELNASSTQIEHYFLLQDSKGRCVAHYLFNQPHLIQRFGKKLPWRLKDRNGQTPLFALCRSYDHEEYHSMIVTALTLATEAQGDGRRLQLDDHVDAKGNTLLHVVNDMDITVRLLRHCDSDVNAANDKRFTPLMVGSKYGRLDLVRALFGDPRTDLTLRELRGLSAVELAKDDEVRNKIDDLVLLSSPMGSDGRITRIVRSFFVEDATVRLVLKSGARNNANGLVTVTTCRRSPADFENLSKWLAIEHPASWLPVPANLPSSFLIPSRPSRALLRDTQMRLDAFFHILLTHQTFATHELVWEFFLMPEMSDEASLDRSQRKAAARVESVKEDYEPLTETIEIENFVAYAREQVRNVTGSTRRVIRATNQHRMRQVDLFESASLANTALNTLTFLPPSHLSALDRYTRTFSLTDADPMASLYYTLHSTYTSLSALQTALNRPAYLIGSMTSAQRTISRAQNSLSRSARWTPNIGLFEDSKQVTTLDAWAKAEKARQEYEALGCELRYTQEVVAGELAGWQEEHVRSGREMLKKLARDMIVKERERLEGIRRALEGARKVSEIW
nr:hypothetical protein B0A51_02900 [Rachicladosporium sp. CCFEE 5018]OQO29874.1 hypothetical protein B0A51_02326 [Rachicladosporium sp. CCFEE 5018]